MMMKSLIIPLTALFAGACSSTPTSAGPTHPPVDCTANAVPGIIATTVDLSTGDTVRTRGTLRLQDGAYSENAVAAPPLYYGAYERPGTYTVTLQVSGYRDWTATGVVITSDRCHVQTVKLSAKLIPTASQ